MSEPEDKPPSKIHISKNTLRLIDRHNKSPMSVGGIITVRKQPLGRMPICSWLSLSFDV